MASPVRQSVLINFAGGWATDFGPSISLPPENGVISLPFLVQADNCFYELDGAPHKVGGATTINSVAPTGTVHGFADFFFQGAAGTEVQKQVAYIGSQYMKMDALDGTWDSLKTGLENNKEPCFTIFKGTAADELVILTTTSTVDVPQKWVAGTAAAATDLTGTPPNFSFVTPHKNRLWAAGVATQPSRLYYAGALNPEDWTGAGDAGSIDIDPGDGDRITGLASHKNELLVFKGPNKLSIHRITGSSPGGSDAFARVPFVSGVGSVNHNGIFRVNDDLVFGSPRGFHSLAATASYGDYIEAFLSRPILSYFQDSLNHSALNTIWGVNYQARGLAIWTVPPSGGTAKSQYLAFDYRFQPGRWARWRNYTAAHSLGVIQTSTRIHRLYSGATDGKLRQLDINARSIDGTGAYTFDVISPYCNFGSSAVMKNAVYGFASLVPKGAYNMTIGWQRDAAAQQTATVSQAGSADTLG